MDVRPLLGDTEKIKWALLLGRTSVQWEWRATVGVNKLKMDIFPSDFIDAMK